MDAFSMTQFIQMSASRGAMGFPIATLSNCSYNVLFVFVIKFCQTNKQLRPILKIFVICVKQTIDTNNKNFCYLLSFYFMSNM